METRMNRAHGKAENKKTLHIGWVVLPLAVWAVAPSLWSSSPKGRPFSEVKSDGSGRVIGRVVRNGKPVGGVRVAVSGEPDVCAVTAADGSFIFDRVPEGNQVVSTTLTGSLARNFSDTRSEIRVKRNGRPSLVELNLIKGGVIAGRIFDPVGVPITNSRVRMYQIDENGNAFGGFASVGSDGRFSSRLSPGDWLVEELPKIGDPNANVKVLAWDRVRLAEGDYKQIELRRIGQIFSSHT
jgi:hypothetical protein